MFVLLVLTVVLGTMVLVAALLGLPRGNRSIFHRAPQWWARALLWCAGTKVVVHGDPEQAAGPGRVYMSNHVSWFDILAMVDILPYYGFVAKREIEKVPVFGPAARTVGVIYIDRENRKAAFNAYEDAAQRIRDGQSVIVYPEGTRGDNYSLRPFKKGPFVLAIQSGVPIIPVAMYGTIEVNRRGSLMVFPGTVHVHLLDAVPTEGLTYDDRDRLAMKVRSMIAGTLRDNYGVPDLGAAMPLSTPSSAVQQHHVPA